MKFNKINSPSSQKKKVVLPTFLIKLLPFNGYYLLKVEADIMRYYDKF